MSHPRPESNSVRNKEIEVNLFLGHPRHNYVSHIGKAHTCEGGAHLRISFWNLLMNLKNKLLKKLLKWANKNKKNLIFTMLHFIKKYKEKTY